MRHYACDMETPLELRSAPRRYEAISGALCSGRGSLSFATSRRSALVSNANTPRSSRRSAIKKFMCMGALPPQDHPHVFCDMGEDVEYVCPYRSTLYRHNPGAGA